MFSCKQAARLFSESCDRELSFSERVALRFHLVICRLCRLFAGDMRRFGAGLREYSKRVDAGVALAEVALPPDARRRILQALEKDRS